MSVLPMGSQLKGGAQPCTQCRDPLFLSLPQSSLGSMGALSTALPCPTPTPPGESRQMASRAGGGAPHTGPEEAGKVGSHQSG